MSGHLIAHIAMMLFSGAYFERVLMGWGEFVDVERPWERWARRGILGVVCLASAVCYGLSARVIIKAVAWRPNSVEAALLVGGGILVCYWVAKLAERVIGR